LDEAVAEGYLTSSAASEGPAHSAGFLGFLDGGLVVREGDGLSIPEMGDSELAVDLGTGGGVPGLVLATLTPWRWILVDRGDRRATFLRWAVRQLGLEDRVDVLLADAVDIASGELRGAVSLVTARGFAPPGSTAECAAPLLAEQGVLVVSEPPGITCGSAEARRWPAEGLSKLGLEDLGGWTSDQAAGPAGYRAMVRIGACPDRFPRRFARQMADPLF